ncbi:MAG: hypothetical protein Q7R30_13760 [Acidobacteriota bacterium]|nr:hypothetical protein [Acidobacteriota bacterium]
MTEAELMELEDPFFRLVLKQPGQMTSLSAIEDRLQPNRSQRQVFVVSEDIARSSHGQRRMVVSFDGTSSAGPLDGNVMLSVFFDPNGPDGQPIEAWGWDERRGRYNYYKLDSSPSQQQMFWTFRGSSDLADHKSPSERQGTCLSCHINGAPIMKELFFPWNNWDSFKFRAQYLRPSGLSPWPIARSPRLTQLSGAESLEGMIMSSLDRFNRRRVADLVSPTDSRRFDARLVLKPIFATTEVNIVSADVESGMHPFQAPRTGRPTSEVVVPSSFFLNVALLSTLGISEANRFNGLARLNPEEYSRLISETRTLFDDEVGDTLFAWFTPEPSHIDNNYVAGLISSGLVSRDLIAAAQLVDLERPVLSADRESLLSVIPARVALGGDGAALKSSVLELARLQKPDSTSPTAFFVETLASGQAIERLRLRVVEYLDRETKALGDPATRSTELSRLYQLLLRRRRDVLRHPELSALDETGGLLFPLPK